MEDEALLLYMSELEVPATVKEIIAKIRESEGLTSQQLIDKFDHNFSGRLRDLVDKGLLQRIYVGSANQYSLTDKGKAEVSKILG